MNETNFYDLPLIRSTRFTTMGKGERTDFAKLNKKSSEKFYDLPSDFNPKKPVGSAYSFGISRDFYKKVYLESNKSIDCNNPGPANYDIRKKLGDGAPKFSMYSRIENDKLFNIKEKKIPGPGEYNQISINSMGKYPISNYANITNICFGSNKDKRFNYKYHDNPPPGKYDVKSDFDGTGKCFISKYKSSCGKTLSGRLASKPPRFQTPGPGAYSTFSEFGFYQLKPQDFQKKSIEKKD